MVSHVHLECPIDSMSDKEVSISVSGLEANKEFTIHACATLDNGTKFESFAIFKSSITGSIDLTNDCPLGGTYTCVSPMGIFWSMIPSPTNKVKFVRFIKTRVTTPLPVAIKVYKSAYWSLEKIHESIDNNCIAVVHSININRWFMGPNTTRTPLNVNNDGIHGVLFMPEGPGPFPGVVIMFGGQPGVTEFKASLLASRGFAALALGIFGHEYGLPEYFSTDPLQISYFQKAIDYLLGYKQVSQNGIGVISVSFSGCIALAMAECCDKVKCVIWINGLLKPFNRAIVSKHKTFPPIEFKPHNRLHFDSNAWRLFYPLLNWHGDIKSGLLKDDFRFDFQNKTNVAYMFIAGLSDDNVPSEYYINYAEELLKHANHPNYKILRYPGAGHLIEPPYGVLNKTTRFVGNMKLDWGGETWPHCHSQEHSWKEQIKFLKNNLVNTVAAKI